MPMVYLIDVVPIVFADRNIKPCGSLGQGPAHASAAVIRESASDFLTDPAGMGWFG